MKRVLSCLLLLGMLLTLPGCVALLNREYGTVQPHSSTYYERENLLRAENYQDLVNSLLLLVQDGISEGVIWLYPPEENFDVRNAVERACDEVRTQTPLGAYAVEYMAYTVDEDNRNYDQIRLTISYRGDRESLKKIMHITGVEALQDLLTAAAKSEAAELVVQMGHFDRSQQEQVRKVVSRVQMELNGPAAENWQVNFYPEDGSVVIIEILLKN
ncbi:MAG: hypothetical protein E7457_03845 [Ruminococcaceae bacterium]|nr:hypothetical protein [Oscillospiraceae bacterium]